ncbi:MAG: NADH-ubiquinone oxidoreductase-F iron-sulfur binding region domain-containing protein [Terracidiphilus sp.]
MTSEELLQIAGDVNADREAFDFEVNVCVALGCLSQHSDKLKDTLTAEAAAASLRTGKRCHVRGTAAAASLRTGKRCHVRGTGCMGLCAAGPLVRVGKPADAGTQTLYAGVRESDAKDVIGSLGGKPIERLTPQLDQYFRGQIPIVLENSGYIDPEKIDEYIGRDGYQALVKALTEMSPQSVIEQISKSGLRGRGGGGYPTGLKWSTVSKAGGAQKYVICNADEGDPGAFMDRSVLESDPQRVIEGMAIAGYAVGASKGYIYVRAEYPLAVARMTSSLRDARRRGLLGNNICGTTFAFDIEIRLGAGAFVCGEETALIASIEGPCAGNPRPRPPYPAVSGLWESPTLINNVETFANVPPIIRKGAEWYASIGTEKSKGTKVFALTGKITNTGLVEIPMGMPLREIIFELAGGVPNGRKFKAVQTGGPSGGCIPEEHLDLPISYEALIDVGSMMGSGGMIVMDDTSCMVNVARFFMEFCMTESCGKCIPCRAGTAQMYQLLTKICDGRASHGDLDLLVDLCDVVKNTSPLRTGHDRAESGAEHAALLQT